MVKLANRSHPLASVTIQELGHGKHSYVLNDVSIHDNTNPVFFDENFDCLLERFLLFDNHFYF